MGNEKGGQEATAKTETLGAVRDKEADILYLLLFLFTWGQFGLIAWDLLMQLPQLADLIRSLGLARPELIHSRGELTATYLSLIGVYIGRNALRRYKGEDSEQISHRVFLGMTRGYFYLKKGTNA